MFHFPEQGFEDLLNRLCNFSVVEKTGKKGKKIDGEKDLRMIYETRRCVFTTCGDCRKSPEASSKKKGKSARVWANEGKNTADLDFSSAGDNEGLQNGSAEDSKSVPTQAEVGLPRKRN